MRRRILRALRQLVVLAGLFAPLHAQAQPVATATVTPPASPLIGDPLIVPVTFDNTGAATGFGPFIDLVLPATGADGAGAATDDGITFVSATYLGQPVTAVTLTFNASGNATHPYARTNTGAAVVVTGTPGDQLVVLQLPFGSFTAPQPAATVQVTTTLSNLADAGTVLNLRARGGFQYGADALDNPPADPSILGAFTANQPVTPAVWRMTKTYIGPEDETATGPNFPRQYRIDVDVAAGQTVTNLDLIDLLPASMQYIAVVSTLVNNVPAATTAVSTPSTTTPGGTLTRRFASVTGTTGTQDASLIFSYYVPRVAAGGAVIIDAVTGDDATSVNDARSQGNWTPIDGRDAATLITNDATANDHTLTPKSIAIQKGVTIAVDTGGAGPTPGDTLEYTLQIQVSDYFALQDLVVTDLISDGQRRDPGFTPTLAVNEHSGGTLAAAGMANPNATFVVSGATGETTATFNVGAEQVFRLVDARLLGGCVPAAGTGGPAPDCAVFNGGGTTVTIVYRTVIQDAFSNTYPSGDQSVDHGDRLTNTVNAQADLLSVANVTTLTGSNEADGSGAGVTILAGTLTKTIYAINGNTSFGTARMGPGDTVTYRLRYTLPSSDMEPVTITDYLPLPVLFATEMAGPPFNTTVDAAVPAAGTAKFGPADTFFALSGSVPLISVDSAGNAVAFDYPAFDDPLNRPTTIDILFTVTASNQPFADGLFLTNQARVQEGSTNAGNSIVDAIVQILLNEPNVRVTKGAVTSSNGADVYAPATVGPVTFSAPGSGGYRGSGTITSNGLTATPINSNVSQLDAGDTVTFAIVLENIGSGPEGAFDVTLRDTIPAGFVTPASLAALNLSVTDGTGTAIPFTDLGGGPFGSGGGLFGAGLRLNDPGASQGALATYGATTGTNIAVITYDLVLAASVGANQTLTNTATLDNFAGTESGPDFTTVDRTDTAAVTTALPTATKAIQGTNQAHTTGTTVAIGERVSYRVTLTIPEGTTPSAVLTDVLDSGLALVSLDAITASAGLSAANGAFNAILAAATVGPEPVGSVAAADQGRRIGLDFGALTNSDTDNATAETIQLDYTVVVLNSTGNNRGVGRNNAVSLAYTGGSATASAPNVTIAEPTLQVVKAASPTGGDAGDTVTFTVTVSHAGTSNTTAFDVALNDVLPAGLTFVSASYSSGTSPTTLNTAGGLAATWTSFPVGSSTTFQIVGTIDTGLASGTVLTNTATATYTSLPGTVTTAQSPFNTLSTERTGSTSDPGGTENDYTASGSAAVTVSNAAVTKVVVSTDQAHTTGNDVALGEILTYTVTVSVPEAVSNGVTLVDTLDPGLAFVGFDSLVVSNPVAVTTSVGGGFPAVLSGATVSNPGGTAVTAGSRVTFNFGTITNTDTNSAVAETITLTYRAVVLNAAANVRGQLRNNSAAWTAGGSTVTANAPDVTIVEPTLTVDKTAAPIRGDANDAITFTIVVSHAGASNTAAFDAVLTDAIPAGLNVTAGPTHTSGLAPTSLALAAGTLTGTWASFPLGATSTITFTATLDPSIVPGTVTTNTAAFTWTSLPGAAGNQSPYNTLAVERTGNPADPGGAANGYSASDPAAVTLNSNSLAGRVYVDDNNDGLFTVGEAAIAGVVITLTGTDHLGNPVTLTTVTNAGGTYQFTGLRPGTYTVRETQPPAYGDGLDRAGSLGGTLGNDIVSAIAIPLGGPTDATDYDFGERPTADLQVTKTDSPDPVVPGTALTYTLVVRNNGPSVAQNVVFRDPLPTGTAFTSITAPGLTCTTPAVGSAGDVACTTATLAVGATATITLVVQTSPTLLDGAVITNAAAVRSDTIDLVPGNNTDTEPTTVAVGTSADLSIAKTDLADPVVTGANVTYTLTIRNNGPANATNVVATDTLPAGLTLVSATPSQGAPCTVGATISCALGALASGAQATITVVAGTSSAGVVVNTAAVTGSEPDPNPANNTATEPTTIAAPGTADLRIVKVDSPDPTVANGVVAYTLTVENRGPAAATSVVVSDTVPVNTTFEAVTAPAGWACTTPTYGATGAVSCTTATMAVSATAAIVLNVRVAPGTPAGTTLSNTASVTSATPDSDPSNNSDTEPTLVTGPNSVDLAIVKTDAPDPQAAGAPVSYTLTITNHGPATATNVTVIDALPAGTTFLSGSAGCAGAGATVSCTVGTLAAGASTAVGITISTPPVPQVITNSATVSATESDPVPANNTETEDTTLVQRADVQIVKAGPATATAGSTVVYTLTITNNGPSVADTVTVDDATPAGLTFVSNTGACTTAFPCALGTMLPSEVRTITTTFQIPAGYTTPDPIVNTATVSTTTAGDNPSNNTSTVNTALAFAGDVAVVKTASTMTPGVGTSFDFTIVVTNLGPSDVTNAVISDPLPAGVAYQSHVATSGVFVPGTGLWTIPALSAAGGSATLTITVDTLAAGPLPNTATKTTQDQPDPNPANDSSTVTPVATANADVAVVKSGPARVLVNGTVVYTLTVTNNGPAVAAGVVLADPTPANLTFVSNAGACTTAFPCTLGTLAPGAVRTITATYTAGNVPDGTVVTNVATVTSTSPDSNPANNTSSVPTTIVQVTDVGVAKTVAPATVVVGGTVTYTVTTTNNGPNPATGVVVTDQLPTGVSYQSATASQGTYDSVTGAWAIGALNVGQSVTLTITAVVQAPGPITNVAVRTGQVEPDGDPSNDSAVAVVNSPPYADVGVAKSVTPPAPAVGAPITFVVRVTNYGPATAPAVVVDDPIPAGIAPTSAVASAGTFVPGTGRWTVGTLASGDSATLTLVGTTTAAGTLVNRAVVSGTGITDPNPLNDRDAASVVVGPAPPVLPANLKLAKVALRPFVPVNELAEFVITVTNDGPGTASAVTVTESLPPNLVYVDSRASHGVYTPGNGQWSIGTIAPTQSVALWITARATGPGTAVNTATISGSAEPDPDPSDNSGTATVLTPPPGVVDLEITQQLPSVAPPNGLITIRLVTHNLGPNAALNPYITGMIPPGTIFVSSNPGAGGSCTVPGNPPPPDPITGYPVTGVSVPPLTCTWPGLMQPGETRVVEFTVRVAPGIRTGQVLWSCFFTGTQTDEPYQPNNVIDGYLFVDDGVSPVGDLGIQAVASSEGVVATSVPARIGAPVQIRFTASNAGPAAARGQYALILDSAGTLEVVNAATTSGWVAPSSGTSGVWDTGSIAPGQTATLDLTVRLTTAAHVTLFAQRVTGFPGDPNASNERATIVLDGYGATTGGRSVAVGNLDGAGGGEIVTGTGRGETPQVRVYGGNGVDTGLRYFAYERSFLGGVEVASCDVDNDGVAELITVPGPGRAPTVRVLRVTSGVVSELVSFDAFESTFRGGAYVSCADLDGDGSAELVVGAGAGRSPDVKTYGVVGGVVVPRATFTAYEPSFQGGVRVSAMRYAGGPMLPAFGIATTPGAGRAAELRLWTSTGGAVAQAVVSSAAGGVHAALGDADADGALDLVVTPDDGRPELLRAFAVDRGAVLADVGTGLAGFPVGLRVAMGRLGGPVTSELVVANGAGAAPRVRVITWTPAGPVLRLDVTPLEIP